MRNFQMFNLNTFVHAPCALSIKAQTPVRSDRWSVGTDSRLSHFKPTLNQHFGFSTLGKSRVRSTLHMQRAPFQVTQGVIVRFTIMFQVVHPTPYV